MQIHITRKRMKSLRMRVDLDGTVKVSAPKRVSDKQIHDFITSKKTWIQKAQAHYTQKRLESALEAGQIRLHGEIYSYQQTTRKAQNSIDHQQRIIYFHKNLNEDTICEAFYKDYAKEFLIAKLQEFSQTLGLTVAKVAIRGQKTKRGTCSSKKHISLNWKLIKTPPFVYEYVIYHELAHLKHMNHSKAFRETVQQFYPDYKQAEERLKKNSIRIL